MAGVSRLQYATNIRLIRVMCSGRVDMEFVLRAFAKGLDGVLIGGCKLGECNYITHGNYHARNMVALMKSILGHIGLNPERLRIEFMSAGDGIILVEKINEFSNLIKSLGPLGKGEKIPDGALKFRLKAVSKLVPYLRLVERERLRTPLQSKDAYQEYFTEEELDKLFKELIADKLVISQIVMLLKEKPLATGQIAEILGLSPSEVSRYMSSSSRQRLVRYDEGAKCYALA